MVTLWGNYEGISQGIAFKASQLGKKYSWSSLQTLIDFVPEHLTLLKQAQKPTVPASVPLTVPVPSCESEEQAANRETILEKIHQLEEKIRLERQQETVGVIQLRSKLHNTARQIPRQRRLHSWLVLLGHIVALLRRRGMSLLHATAHPFHQILHLHLLTPCHSMTTNPIKEQLVKNNPHPAP